MKGLTDQLKRIERWRQSVGLAAAQVAQPAVQPDIEILDTAADPLTELWFVKGLPQYRRRTLLGMDHFGNLLLGQASQHGLTLGRTRSNKTSGILVNAAIAHVGPVVFMSTKIDPINWLAVARARAGGRLWHYQPDGSPASPGLVQLRYSLIDLSTDDAAALMVGRAIVKGSAVGEEMFRFWQDHAADFIGACCRAAHIAKHKLHDSDATTGWVLRAVQLNKVALDQAEEWLKQSGEPSDLALLDDLKLIEKLSPQLRDSFVVSAGHALRVFKSSAAQQNTENANFDPRAFVAGHPEAVNPLAAWDDTSFSLACQGITAADGRPQFGIYDTIFITARRKTVERAPAAIVALQGLITQAAADQADEDAVEGKSGRPPVLIVCDELGGLAPDPDYPDILREGASQGIMVLSCLQDLAQADEKWGQAVADSFLTLHGELAVFAGIRNQRTADAIIKTLGERDDFARTQSHTDVAAKEPSESWGSSETIRRLPVVTADQLASGHPDDPTMPLYIRPPDPELPSYQYAHTMPAWGQRPWPRLLVTSMEFIVRHCPPHNWRRALLVPDLAQCDPGGYPFLLRQRDGHDLLQRYLAVRDVFTAARLHQQRLVEDPSFSDSQCAECVALSEPEPAQYPVTDDDLALSDAAFSRLEMLDLDEEAETHRQAQSQPDLDLDAEMKRHQLEVQTIRDHFAEKRREAREIWATNNPQEDQESA